MVLCKKPQVTMTSPQYCVILLSMDYKIHYHEIIGQSLIMPHSIAEENAAASQNAFILCIAGGESFLSTSRGPVGYSLCWSFEDVIVVCQVQSSLCSSILQRCSGILHFCQSWTFHTSCCQNQALQDVRKRNNSFCHIILIYYDQSVNLCLNKAVDNGFKGFMWVTF